MGGGIETIGERKKGSKWEREETRRGIEMAKGRGAGEGRGESRSKRLLLFAVSRSPQGCRSQVTPEYKQVHIVFFFFSVFSYMPAIKVSRIQIINGG